MTATSQDKAEVSFISETLSSAIQKASRTFDNHLSNINAISADIRNLEKYLSSRAININFEMMLPQHCPLKDLSGAPHIEWGEYEQKFRLLFLVTEPSFDGRDALVERRPLIETSLETRMAVYPYLSKFVEQLAGALSVNASSRSRLSNEAPRGAAADMLL